LPLPFTETVFFYCLFYLYHFVLCVSWRLAGCELLFSVFFIFFFLLNPFLVSISGRFFRPNPSPPKPLAIFEFLRTSRPGALPLRHPVSVFPGVPRFFGGWGLSRIQVSP